jgi:hypothetical protein
MIQREQIALRVVTGCWISGRPLPAGTILNVSAGEAVRLLAPRVIELVSNADSTAIRAEVHRQAQAFPAGPDGRGSPWTRRVL